MVVTPINPIDGNKVLEILENAKADIPRTIVDESNWKEAMEDILKEVAVFVMRLPTIHVGNVTNTYGYWMPGTGMKVKCSNCMAGSYDDKAHYCPNCGVPMEDKNNAMARLC